MGTIREGDSSYVAAMLSKPNVPLFVSSLLSMLFVTLHIAHDIVWKIAPGGLSNLIVVVFLLLWLTGGIVLGESRTGHVIGIVCSFLAGGVPVVHMMGKGGLTAGVSGNPPGAFFFAWTLIALSVTATFSLILSVRGLWRLRRGRLPA